MREIGIMVPAAMDTYVIPRFIVAYVICRFPEGPRYLLIRRCGKDLPGTWQMVSGGIEKGETAGMAACREIVEETGLVPYALYSADAVETFYMLSADRITFVPAFVAFVEAGEVRLSPKEHDAYEWLPFEEARERLVWSEQRRIIGLVHESFVLSVPHPLLTVDLSKRSIPSEELTDASPFVQQLLQSQKMHFEPLRKGQEEMVREWLSQDYVAEFWHGVGLDNTLKSISRFVNGEETLFTIWIAYHGAIPFGYLMTSNIDPEKDLPYAPYLNPSSKAISLDLLIGNRSYLGRGFGSQMILELLRQKFGDATDVFIDPGLDNPKAIHVYEKAGFQRLEEFIPSWDPSCPCLLMRRKMER